VPDLDLQDLVKHVPGKITGVAVLAILEASSKVLKLCGEGFVGTGKILNLTGLATVLGGRAISKWATMLEKKLNFWKEELKTAITVELVPAERRLLKKEEVFCNELEKIIKDAKELKDVKKVKPCINPDLIKSNLVDVPPRLRKSIDKIVTTKEVKVD
jgi:hypothetical protein